MLKFPEHVVRGHAVLRRLSARSRNTVGFGPTGQVEQARDLVLAKGNYDLADLFIGKPPFGTVGAQSEPPAQSVALSDPGR